MIFCDWQDGNFERQQIQRSKDREIGGGGGGVSGDNNGGCSGRVPWCRPEPGGGAPPLLVRRPRQLDCSGEVWCQPPGAGVAFAAAQVQAKAAEVARITATWQEPVAKSHRELSAGDDDYRRLPSH